MRTNSVEFLVRETLQRVRHSSLGAKPSTMQPPAAVASTPSLRRGGTQLAASTQGFAVPTSAPTTSTPPLSMTSPALMSIPEGEVAAANVEAAVAPAQTLHPVSCSRQDPAAGVETLTPAVSVIENLERRMSMVAPPASPSSHYELRSRTTPQSRSRPSQATAPQPPAAQSATCDAYIPTPLPVRLTEGDADTVPRPEYGLRGGTTDVSARIDGSARRQSLRSGRAQPQSASVKFDAVDHETLDVIGTSRHERGRSRKSFSRSVAHPRSPCPRVVRAGIVMDPKVALQGLRGGEAPLQFAAVDAYGKVRAKVLSDGSVKSPSGRVMAYIEADGTVGSADLVYIGEVTSAAANNSVGYITDIDDELIGKVDYGRAVRAHSSNRPLDRGFTWRRLHLVQLAPATTLAG